MKHNPRSRAFTLIELLVVIAIIALLASIAVPVYGTAQTRGAQTKALAQAKGIYPALKMFAMDHNGAYPSAKEQDEPSGGGPLGDANDAFANLIPGYLSNESPFGNNVSAWSKDNNGTLKGPDNNISSRDKILEKGENVYAYVAGMTEVSNSSWPIIADGFAAAPGLIAGNAAKYTRLEGDRGGVWKGERAIVVRNDGSAQLEKVDRQTLTVTRRTSSGTANLFAEDRNENNPWLVGCTIYNPR
jgi:prepilin-type N-terminal cleavage/methylation domain-containing protein